MTDQTPTNNPDAELKQILEDFGKDYEWPYQFMHDKDRTLAAQQKEARAELSSLTEAKIRRYTQKMVLAELKKVRFEGNILEAAADNYRCMQRYISERITTIENKLKNAS